MPHVPSVNIRNGGIHYLIKVYKSFHKRTKKTIINAEEQKINWLNLRYYLMNLASHESTKIEENLQWKMKFKHKLRPKDDDDKLNFLPCFDTKKEEYLIDNLDSYNRYIMKNIDIDHACRSYLKTLEWTWYYYCGHPKYCLDAYYEYVHGPLFKDIIENIPLSNNESFCNDENKHEEKIHAISQLFFVLPFENHETIIPSDQFEKLKDNVYHDFPLLKNSNFDVDYTFCKYFWEGHLILDHIDFFELNKLITNNI